MKLGKYSIGVGDRFIHQGEAQLRAIMKANETGLRYQSGLEQIEQRTYVCRHRTG